MNRARFGPLTAGILPARDRAPVLQDAPQQGTAVATTAAGVLFTVDGLPGQELGPAAWPIGVYATRALALSAGHAPAPGDRILVVFAGVGIDTPWVLAWTR